MARTCFYCGRSLQTGEKCHCRSSDQTKNAGAGATGSSAGSSGTYGSSGSSGSAGTAGASGNAEKSSNPKTSWKKAESKSRSGSAGSDWKKRFTRPTSDRRTDFAQRLPVVLARLRAVSRYVMEPVEVIRQHVKQPLRQRTIGFFAFQIIAAGLLTMTAARQPALAILLGPAFALYQPALQFAAGAAISLAALLLWSLSYMLLLKYAYRQPVRLHRIAEAMTPVSLYLGLFLTAALFSVRSSPISSVVLVMLGLAVGLLTQFFSMRQMTAMEENRLVMLVFSASFLASTVLGTLLGLF